MNREHVVIWENQAIDSQRIWDKSQDKFKEFYASELRNLQAAEKAFRNLVVLLLRNSSDLVEPKVTSRIKNVDECIKKFKKKYRDNAAVDNGIMDIKSMITDLIGLRVTCIYESDVEIVKDCLLQHFEKIGLTNKTRLLEEDDDRFGYKGIHLDLRLNEKRKVLPEYTPFDGVCFEIQIRTIVQDAWSEVDHKLKYKRQIPQSMKRRINRLSALFELADQEFEAIRDMTIDLKNKAAKQADEGIISEELLDVIQAEKILKDIFPTYSPNPKKLEDFIEEVSSAKGDVTNKEFHDYIFLNKDEVFKFKEHLYEKITKNLTPPTVVRHCLYMARPTIFDSMLEKHQIKSFELWKSYGTIDAEEIETVKRNRNIIKTHNLNEISSPIDLVPKDRLQ